MTSEIMCKESFFIMDKGKGSGIIKRVTRQVDCEIAIQLNACNN